MYCVILISVIIVSVYYCHIRISLLAHRLGVRMIHVTTLLSPERQIPSGMWCCCCWWVKVSDLCRLSSPKHTVSIFLLSESMWQRVFVFTDLFDQGGVCGAWSRVCMCVCVCDVCWELRRKHEVKLCLLSSWDRIIDPPSGLTLVINRALHQEDVRVKKAQSECLFFPRSVTYKFSHWRSHPKQVTLNIRSLKIQKYQSDWCLLGISSLSHLNTGDAASEAIWGFSFCSRTLQHIDWRVSGLNWGLYH